MQPIKILEVLPTGQVRVELPKKSEEDAKRFQLSMILMLEQCSHTPEELEQFQKNLKEKMPKAYERYMAYRATNPRT